MMDERDAHGDDEDARGQAAMNPTEIHEFVKTSQKQLAESIKGKPSKETGAYWLYAEGLKRSHPEPTGRSGKWLVFCKPEEIDEIWTKVKRAVAAGNLGRTAKCSTRKGPVRPTGSARDRHHQAHPL
jgi:Domain of unknown function (DUF1917)